MVYWRGKWSPICGHYFWNNHVGASLFCQKLGYTNGTHVGKGSGQSYAVDTFKVGQCDAHNTWKNCTGGCNDDTIGGMCVGNNNADCSAGQPVKITLACVGNSSQATSCKGIEKFTSSIVYILLI